jgi:hypothetical protein
LSAGERTARQGGDDEITSLERQLSEAKERKLKEESKWSLYRVGACFGRKTNTEKKFTAWKVVRIFREQSIWEEYLDYEDKGTEVISIEGPYRKWQRVPTTPEAFLKVGQTYTKYGYSDVIPISEEEYERLRDKVIDAIALGQKEPQQEQVPP